MMSECTHGENYNAGFCPWCELHQLNKRIKELEAENERLNTLQNDTAKYREALDLVTRINSRKESDA
jgi:hypothetical protein